jgi:hypothetical protein
MSIAEERLTEVLLPVSPWLFAAGRLWVQLHVCKAAAGLEKRPFLDNSMPFDVVTKLGLILAAANLRMNALC